MVRLKLKVCRVGAGICQDAGQIVFEPPETAARMIAADQAEPAPEQLEQATEPEPAGAENTSKPRGRRKTA